jgi:hypothetical protein
MQKRKRLIHTGKKHILIKKIVTLFSNRGKAIVVNRGKVIVGNRGKMLLAESTKIHTIQGTKAQSLNLSLNVFGE